MSKISKLVRDPHAFFRDALLKRLFRSKAKDAVVKALLSGAGPDQLEVHERLMVDTLVPEDFLDARAARDMGAHSAALVRAVVKLRKSPKSAYAVLMVGNAMRSLGFEKEARDFLESTPNPSEREVFTWARAATAVSQEDGTSAWEKAHRLYPNSIRIVAEMARMRIDDLDYASGFKLLEQAIADHPNDSLSHRSLAKYYQQIGDWTRWREMAEKNAARFPRDPSVMADLAKCLVELGRAGEADQVMSSVVLNHHDRTDIKRTVARRYFAERRLPEAIAVMKEICSGRDAGYMDEFNLAMWQFASGDLANALAHLQLQENRFPGVFRFSQKIAQALERLDQNLKAFEAWKRVHFLQASNLGALAGGARCLGFLERKNEFESWLEFFPKTPLRPVQTGLHQAWYAWRSGDPVEAKKAFQAAHAVLLKQSSLFQSHSKKYPDQIYFRNAWHPHPNPLGAEANGHFWNLIERIRKGRVVIVGNSPCILNSGLGAEIDAHDVVIRLNDFMVEGYEKDVGSKTTVWYTSADRFAQLKARQLNGFEILLRQAKAQHFPKIEDFTRARLGLADVHASRAYYLPTHYYELLENVLYPSPSTGLRIILLLLSVLDQPISLAGFDFFVENANHYFEGEEKRLPVGEVHAIRFESEFVLGLLKGVGAVRIIG